MKNVKLADFRTPAKHDHVKEIVFRGEMNGSSFDIGFLPEAEFIYHFDISPDVFFQNLHIKGVYYEPYRTFLRLKFPISVEMYWHGVSDKLYVKSKIRNLKNLEKKVFSKN
jgi:hypothetical protein